MADKIYEVGAGSGGPFDASNRQRSTLKEFIYFELYKRNVWVRACVDKIAKRATRDLYRIADDADPQNPDIEILTDFLERANPGQSFNSLLRGIFTDMLIFGRAYLYIEYTMGGAVLNLWPLDARITYPVTDGHGEITGHVQNYQGKIEEFGTEEVIFFPLVTSGSEVEGLSPLETLLDSIAMEINAEKFNAMLFENNLNVGAIISLPDATEEQAQEAQDYLERKYSTPANAHRPLILRQKAELVKDGAAKINDIGWEKLIEVSRQKVCAVYGVPEHNLGISKNSNKASGLSHDRAFWTDTVQPLVSMAYGHVTHQFIRGAWQSASLYLLEPLQAVLPTGEEIDAALKIAQVGATYNYIRQLVGMEPVPNGDVYVIWTPGGYLRLDKTAIPGLGNPDTTNAEAEEEQAELEAEMAAPADGQGADAQEPDGDEGDTEQPESTIIDLTGEADTQAPEQVQKSELEQAFDLLRADVLHPGSRGGIGYRDAMGRWHYGMPPDAAAQRQRAAKAQAAKDAKAAKHAAAQARKAANAAKKQQAEAERKAKAAQREQERIQKQKQREAEKAQREAERRAKEQQRASDKSKREAEAKARQEQRDREHALREAERKADKAQKEAEHKAKEAAKEAQRLEHEAQQAAADAIKQAIAEQKQQMAAAKQELADLNSSLPANPAERQAALEQAGWQSQGSPAATPQAARQQAQQLASANPANAYAIVKVGTQYTVVAKPLSNFGTSGNVAGGTVQGQPAPKGATAAPQPLGGAKGGNPLASVPVAQGGTNRGRANNASGNKPKAKRSEEGEQPLQRVEALPYPLERAAGHTAEQELPYMAERVKSTQAGFDSWQFSTWREKVKQATAAEIMGS